MINGSKVNVYVFGAGASVHVDAPLTKDFVAKGFLLLPITDGHGKSIYDLSMQKFMIVAKLIDRLYGSRLEMHVKEALSNSEHVVVPSFPTPSVNIEDLLSFVDLALRRCETWLPFAEIQDALHEFIFTTLEQATFIYNADIYRGRTEGEIDHSRNYYDRLVDYIMPVNETNCVITFNYDLFLDKAVRINNHGIMGDYNIEFAGVEHFARYEERVLSKRRKKEDVDILKLHGSLNWARCPHCPGVFLRSFWRYKQILSQTCSLCRNDRLVPVLVPPTSLKQMDIPELLGVWNRAEYFLERADTLTVIGYSFPDADIEAKWLFKRAIAKNPGRPALTLVEPESYVREKVINFLGRFFQDEPVFFDTFKNYCEQKQEVK